jgi:molybdate-binding protein
MLQTGPGDFNCRCVSSANCQIYQRPRFVAGGRERITGESGTALVPISPAGALTNPGSTDLAASGTGLTRIRALPARRGVFNAYGAHRLGQRPDGEEPRHGEASLARLVQSELIAAAMHFHTLDDQRVDANAAVMRDSPNLRDAVLIAFARRDQGLIVAAGNPLGLGSLGDVAASEAHLAVRPRSAGAQLLLQSLLHRAKMKMDRLACVGPPCPTGPDIAQAIRAGRADCGIAAQSVASAAGLELVPFVWKRFDLAKRQRAASAGIFRFSPRAGIGDAGRRVGRLRSPGRRPSATRALSQSDKIQPKE